MTDWIVSALMLAGGVMLFLAAVGVMRMPDLYTRMQAATKAGTLGAGLLLLAPAVVFDNLGVTMTSLLAIGFLILTAPVAAHMIGRAAYLAGVPLWNQTVRDELREQRLAVRKESKDAGETNNQ